MDEAEAGDPAALVAEERHRRDQEPDDQRPRLAGWRAARVLAQDLDLLRRAPIAALLELRPRQRVELDLVGPGGHVGAGQLAELADLGVGEGGLRRAAPAEQVHLAHAALAERVERVVADVGRRQLLGRPAEDAHHVDRDVADAHHRHPLLREVEPVLAVVGVPVVPGDEVGRRVAAAEVLAGNAHAAVGLGARGVDDLMVVRPEVLERHVLPELDVAEEAEPGVRGRLVEGGRDVLDLLVVGRDAEADQPVRRRQAVEQVDLDGEARPGGRGARRCRTRPAPRR